MNCRFYYPILSDYNFFLKHSFHQSISLNLNKNLDGSWSKNIFVNSAYYKQFSVTFYTKKLFVIDRFLNEPNPKI